MITGSRQKSTMITVSGQASTMSDQKSFVCTASDNTVSAVIITYNNYFRKVPIGA